MDRKTDQSGHLQGVQLTIVIPAEAGIHFFKFSGFRIKCGMTKVGAG